MADLFHCGFDFFDQAGLLQIFDSTANLSWTVSSAAGRRGGGAALLAANSQGQFLGKILPSTYSTLILGVAPKFTSNPSSVQPILGFGDTGFGTGAVQVTIAVDSNLAIRAYRGTVTGTLLGTSATAVVPLAAFFYIEAKVLISATVGTVEVRINGNATPVLNLTAQNTKNTANTTMSQVGAATVSGGSSTNWFDDFYVCDTSGSDNNDFLGDQRIDAGYPISDGHYQDWTPSSAGAHFSKVNAHPEQITTFVSDGTPGNKDTYTFTALTSITGTIRAVQITAFANKSDAGARSLQILTRSNVTDVASSAVALATGTTFYRSMQERNPDGNIVWTEATVNAAQHGLETA